jgi:hypothetical protein
LRMRWNDGDDLEGTSQIRNGGAPETRRLQMRSNDDGGFERTAQIRNGGAPRPTTTVTTTSPETVSSTTPAPRHPESWPPRAANPARHSLRRCPINPFGISIANKCQTVLCWGTPPTTVGDMVLRAPAVVPQHLDASKLARAGLATFFNIAEEWQLDSAKQMTLLGLTSRTTFFRWKKVAPTVLPPDTLERLSHVFGIYKSLQILLPGTASAGWVHRPNDAPLFGGRSALDLMLGGVAGLFLVRAYLDGERGGDFA